VILQRDENLPESFHRKGCYEMSLLFLVNKLANVSMSPPRIKVFDKMFTAKNWVQNDEQYQHYIRDPEAIFGHFGIEAKMLVKGGTHHIEPSYAGSPNEVEILFFKRPGQIGHFVVGDGHGHVAYDPYGVSNSVKFGRLESKRVFRIANIYSQRGGT
jgi:uncharacterized protein (DUF1330 family)